METEAVLLSRFARTGDAEAFGEIIRRHAGLVYGAAWRIVADMDRASDVAQETFLQLTKDAAKVTGSLPGWLHRVATRKAIDLVRRDTSRKHREVQYATQQPRRITAWREISPHVDEGLNALDPELREILVAHFLEGQTTRQIAGRRGISQATVSRRLEAGVTKLRARLRKRGLLVGAGALSLLLRKKAINAAPAALKAELGKMALVGGHAALCAPESTASVYGFRALFEGVLAGIKAKSVAAAAVAAVTAGSFVAYQQAKQPAGAAQGTPAKAAISAAAFPYEPTGTATGDSRTAMAGGGASDEARSWERIIRAALDSSAPQNAPVAVSTNTAPGDQEDIAQPPRPTDATGANDEAYASRATAHIPGPNDANDPNDTSAEER